MKKLTTFFLFLFIVVYTQAAFFKAVPVEVTLPDHTILHCFSTGDEYYRTLHDAAGYSIVQSKTDGYYYYAIKSGDELVASSYRVGSVDPSTLGITPWLTATTTVINARTTEMVALKMQKARAMKIAAVNKGVMSNIVIYVRFKGDAEYTKTRKDFSVMLEGTTSASLKNYFEEVSYGKFSIKSLQFPLCDSAVSLSYEATQPRGYYSPYNATTNTIGYVDDSGSREQALVESAINAISAQVPSNVVVDADGDGYVDNVTVVIRGNADGWGKLLWPHQWSLYMKSASILGKRVGNYIFITENLYNLTTMCHEMFHVVGAPDLYHYTGNGIDPVGQWDLMQSGSCHPSAYMKWKYTAQNWIGSIPEITKSGDYTVLPLTNPTRNCWKVKSPYSSSEYFVLEYRRKSGMFEKNLPQSGLTITRINTQANGNAYGPPDEVFLCRPQGTIYSNGDLSLAAFNNYFSRATFNNSTNPRATLSDGSDAGVNISNIVFKGDSMNFKVTITDPIVQKSTWLVTADSYESASAYSPATLVKDDNSNTIWHTPWSSNVTAYPHWVQVNFNKRVNIKGFRYLPRQDMDNGRIKDYDFLTSVDGVNWTKVTSGTFPNSKVVQTVTFAERNCKYAKLLAKNEVNGKTFASMAELNFVFGNSMLPRTKWRLLNASSFETGKNPELAFDSLGTTFWLSKYTSPAAVYPHELAIDMNDTCCLESFAYLPRQDASTDGTIAKYEFYTSLDASNWILASKGQWANNKGEKLVTFPKSVCRYVKLVALSEVSTKAYANIAEISLYGAKSNDVLAPDKPTNFSIASRNASTLKLNWDVNSADNSILYYQVFTPDSVLGKVYANELSAIIDTTKNYQFSLIAVDGSGNQSEAASLLYTGLTGTQLVELNLPVVYSVGSRIMVSEMTGENKILISNVLGEIIYTKICNSPEVEINLGEVPGVYIVSVVKNNQPVINRKVLIGRE